MTKIEEYFPSHTKRANNFRRNLGVLLSKQPGITDYDFYDFHEQHVTQSREKIYSGQMTAKQKCKLERRLDKYDIQTAKESAVGVLVYSELESLLILLSDDIDRMTATFGGETVPDVATIYEQHEANLSHWLFSTVYFFAD